MNSLAGKSPYILAVNLDDVFVNPDFISRFAVFDVIRLGKPQESQHHFIDVDRARFSLNWKLSLAAKPFTDDGERLTTRLVATIAPAPRPDSNSIPDG